MSHWNGRMGRGTGRARRIEKREEAQQRDKVSTYSAEIGRVSREQNVSLRTARFVVNAERKLSARKRRKMEREQAARGDRAAGYGAYLLAEPEPEHASLAWRQGWEQARDDEDPRGDW